MQRYLLNISYIGTPFRGAQRQVKLTKLIREDTSTIQGRIEIGLRNLKPANDVSVVTSSRTDSGVHALQSTMHVDLISEKGRPYPPESLTVVLNKYFIRHELPIRVIRTYCVPPDFHSRNAESRTYMYRLGIIKSENINENNVLKQIPIEEIERVSFISTSTFDVEKFSSACKLFHGLHDFRSFMAKGTKKPDKMTRRVIKRLEIVEASGHFYNEYSWPTFGITEESDCKFYNIFIESNGFLYKQVRRILAALIGIAKGVITEKDVRCMLEVPSHNSWDSRIKTAPPQGLYLCQVKYPKEIQASFRSEPW
ncbi:PREDICTED: tRNA pseudouridine synthase-like 1 [Nicrophorus vespilloides]|uniref:tRNA pseudouridine synthase n=1 Tax=Nicrophorus vespilloides TaxID=110193 RepID=A0ABM1MWK8_NICVS|nr:PREDICTED: tRNA pseudouridine synthase-like 1 [Nicrophorus vespilloides]